MAFFQDFYVKIAEATAASRDALDSAVGPLGDTADYNGTGLSGNIKTIVDTQTTGETGGFEDNNSLISEVQFEIANLIAANSTWTQVRDLATSGSAYAGLVVSLNNYVINNVLGKDTDDSSAVPSGTFSTTLQGFLDNDCDWSDASTGGVPASWITLMNNSGFDVS